MKMYFTCLFENNGELWDITILCIFKKSNLKYNTNFVLEVQIFF